MYWNGAVKNGSLLSRSFRPLLGGRDVFVGRLFVRLGPAALALFQLAFDPRPNGPRVIDDRRRGLRVAVQMLLGRLADALEQDQVEGVDDHVLGVDRRRGLLDAGQLHLAIRRGPLRQGLFVGRLRRLQLLRRLLDFRLLGVGLRVRGGLRPQRLVLLLKVLPGGFPAVHVRLGLFGDLGAVRHGVGEGRPGRGEAGAALVADQGFEPLRRHEVADVGEVERQQRDEDEDAAEQGVEEELDGGVLAARPAPDADEEVHRQQHHFPEDVKQEEVERQERAQHAGFEDQKQDAVAAHELVDLPAGDHRQKTQGRGQQDEGHADAVGAEEVVDVEIPDPLVAADPVAAPAGVAVGDAFDRGDAAGQRRILAGLRGVEDAVALDGVVAEVPEHADAEAERQRRPDQGPPAHGVFLPAREEQQPQREHAGHEHHQRHPDRIPFPLLRKHVASLQCSVFSVQRSASNAPRRLAEH